MEAVRPTRTGTRRTFPCELRRRTFPCELRRTAAGVRVPWDSGKITLSCGIVEAVAKSEYESEDIVTDLINRAEVSMEEARKLGGNTVIALESPKL